MAMFTPNMTRWLARNVPGKTFDEAASVFNGRFGCEFTPRQIKGHCVYHGIKAGRKGRKGRGYKIGTECAQHLCLDNGYAREPALETIVVRGFR